jgi:superkiller protein 3
LETAKKTLGINPSDDEAYVNLGWAYEDQVKYIEAESAFKMALGINPKNDEAYKGLGQAYHDQGKRKEAESAFKKALGINSRNGRAYVELGHAYDDQGKYSEAVAAFKKALAINPRNDDAYAGLGWVYNQGQGKFAEAEAAFKKALGINSNNDWSYFNLGRAYRNQGKFAEAALAFRKALGINPQNNWAYAELVWLCVDGNGNLSHSRKLLEESIKMNSAPTDRMYGALATAHAAMGDIRHAKQYHEKAEELRLREYDSVVADNYRRLKGMLDRRGVRLVCVQYPMRGIAPLRKIFQGRDAGIVFVDNENVFKEAVERNSLQEYFRDMFAGDFGHCTPKGNELLARNIAAVLAREVFTK